MKACIAPCRVLWTPAAGGHAWVYLNWALGLQANGCEVVWLEDLPPDLDPAEAVKRVCCLRHQMDAIGLHARIALLNPPTEGSARLTVSWEAAAEESDLFLNFYYGLPPDVVRRFRRSVLVDIDPGLLQIWISTGGITVARHDINFTIGETVGRLGAVFPDCGMRWCYTRSPVYLPAWPVAGAGPDAPYTTVTNWWGGEWLVFNGTSFSNDKRRTYLEYVDLPLRVSAPLELAVCLSCREQQDADDRRLLERKRWRVQHAWHVTGSPLAYNSYIKQSRGEFSCAKPSCMLLENTWISDRTLCYLASGKPAIVQHTGASDFLPDAEGLFRFRSMEEAVRALSMAESEYERHSRAARALAEEFFDARKVVGTVLERALA
jgi:hypothetical protein